MQLEEYAETGGLGHGSQSRLFSECNRRESTITVLAYLHTPFGARSMSVTKAYRVGVTVRGARAGGRQISDWRNRSAVRLHQLIKAGGAK